MDDLYQEEIIDHYKNPRNFGDMENPTVKIYEANASCGDVIEISMKIKGGKIEGIKFKGDGCALSMAATSKFTEGIKGRSIEFLKNLDEKYILDLIGVDVSSGRMNCVLLPLKTIERILLKLEEESLR